MSIDDRKSPERNPLITTLLLPSTSVDIGFSEDDVSPAHLRNTSQALSICAISTPTYHDHQIEFQPMANIPPSDTDNDDISPPFHVPDLNTPPLSSYSDNRKRSLINLNINIHCAPLQNEKEKRNSKELQQLLVLDESRSVQSNSVHIEDNIGDLGNLSDFTDSENTTNCYAPYRANEELQFVDVDDCDFMNDSNIDLLSHIHIDIPCDAMDILCRSDRNQQHIEFEMEQNADDEDDDDKMDDITYATANRTKRVSYFRPNTFDICLMTSSPFCVSQNKDPHYMEYLQHSLPNRQEIKDAVRETLLDRKCGIRYAHFNGTRSAINCIASGGGCKILQFVGYCCNPAKDSEECPEICTCLSDQYGNEDIDYILLQDDDNKGVGIWQTKEELFEILNESITKIDVIICISPQHKRMIEIFTWLGYEYVIGIESPCDDRSFSGTESMTFLTHLYHTLLDCTSVSHAFYLSMQAALSFRGGSHTKISNCDSKYVLNCVANDCSERYVVFNNKITKDPDDKFIDLSQFVELPAHNLREIIRPMIGRSQYISSLIHNLSLMPIINVSGREYIGKASVVKYALRYLLEMGLFRGGCFLIDCKAKKYQNVTSFEECVANVMQSCGVYDFVPCEESVCFVILNTNNWHKGQHDIEKWIDHHHNQLFENAESRVICTGSSALNIASMDTLNMRELSDLSPSELAALFEHFCGHILEQTISQKEIETNSELQDILSGSPGMTQKVAQFAIFTLDEQQSLTLDDIVSSYRNRNASSLKLSSHAASEPFHFAATSNQMKSVYRIKESQSLCLMQCATEHTPEPYPLIDSFPASRSLPSPISNIINQSNHIKSRHIMNKSMEFAKECVLDLNAQEIWNKAQNGTLRELYPHLVEYFAQNTHENERIPTQKDIESFFIKNGGAIRNKISFNDFENRFFTWFSSMCDMLCDLHQIYETNTPLFYSRDLAKEAITHCAAGTFIVRFASQPNGLAITYKKMNGKISNVLLKRISHRIYRVGKSDKQTDLCNLIDSWSKLKYLYISRDSQIAKDHIAALKRCHHNISCSLSMTQSTTQRSEDFYACAAEVDDHKTSSSTATALKSQLDEIVMNFSDFTNHLNVNMNDDDDDAVELETKCKQLNEENMNLLQKMSLVEEENTKLKQLLSSQYSPRVSSSSTSNVTISTISNCSTPCSPFDIKPCAVYTFNHK